MTDQRRPGKYPDELRERAVRMVLESRADYDSYTREFGQTFPIGCVRCTEPASLQAMHARAYAENVAAITDTFSH